jgi:hypothetical protein
MDNDGQKRRFQTFIDEKQICYVGYNRLSADFVPAVYLLY